MAVPRQEDLKPYYESMSTVLSINVPKEYPGMNVKDKKDENWDKIYKRVEAKVKSIVDKLKISHEKFADPDFGPNATNDDEYGSASLYGIAPPNPVGVSKYPKPDSLRWDRPQYDDDKFVEAEDTEDEGDEEDDEFDDFGPMVQAEDEVWCMHGKLFIDGTSSGDVIQGQLGDCWFLGALAVMGSREELLQECFWPSNKGDLFKEHGLFVLRFFKDTSIVFVIIDDRIPVYQKNGKVVFAQCRDPNELWVPFIEKAYAKLHGCYKALIGGYSHYALGDMTGYSPRLIGLREGYMGFSDKLTKDEVWDLLMEHKEWRSLMGCSIQSKPGEGPKVEAKAADGLIMGHAYSLLDLGKMKLPDGKTVELIKCRNPWGKGEWMGKWGDRSDIYQEHKELIKKTFTHTDSAGNQIDHENIVDDANDGTFFMEFEDWFNNYTNVFIAVNFPDSWKGQQVSGNWSGDEGGNRDMVTWVSNPKIRLTFEPSEDPEEQKIVREGRVSLFVGLYINDSRLLMGVDYYKHPLYATALAFDIVEKADLEAALKSLKKSNLRHDVPNCADKDHDHQPPYMFGTTQKQVELKTVGESFFIVPSLYKRNQPGQYYITVFSNVSFKLDPNYKMKAESEPLIRRNQISDVEGTAAEKVAQVKDKALENMTTAQFLEKKETLRERLLSEMKRLSLSVSKFEFVLGGSDSAGSKGDDGLKYLEFKRKMIDMGFSLVDLPDDDLRVLDIDGDGTISPNEFLTFIKEGMAITEGKGSDNNKVPTPPAPPVDDLLFQNTTGSGILTVRVIAGKDLRKPTTWLSKKAEEDKASLDASKAGASGHAAIEDIGAKNAIGEDDGVGKDSKISTLRSMLKYDAEAAAVHRKAVLDKRDDIHKAVAKKNNKHVVANNSVVEQMKEQTTLGDIDLNSPTSSPNRSPMKGTLNMDSQQEQLTYRSEQGNYHHTDKRMDKFAEVGMRVGNNLHNQDFLVKAEKSRVRNVYDLRKKFMEAKGGRKKDGDPGVLRKKTSAGSNKDPQIRLWDKLKGTGDPHTLAYLGFYKVKENDKRKIQPNKEKIDNFFGTSAFIVDNSLSKFQYEKSLEKLTKMNERKNEADMKRKADEEHLRLLKGITKRKKLNKDTGCYELKDVKISYRHGPQPDGFPWKPNAEPCHHMQQHFDYYRQVNSTGEPNSCYYVLDTIQEEKNDNQHEIAKEKANFEGETIQCYHQHYLCKHYGGGLGTIGDIVEKSMKSFWESHPNDTLISAEKDESKVEPINLGLTINLTNQVVEANKDANTTTTGGGAITTPREDVNGLQMEGIMSSDNSVLPDMEACSDLWDDLIDITMIICESRGAREKEISRVFNSWERLGPKKVLFEEDLEMLKRAQAGSLNSEPEPGIRRSNAPLQSGTASRVGTGVRSLPRTPRSIHGTASVSKAKSKEKERKDLKAAEAKLQQISSRQCYELIYCRLEVLSCISVAELFGDKSVVEIDMHYAPSGAMISHLFDRFDVNKDGRLNQQEFKTMLAQVNIDLHQDEFELLFERFDDNPVDGTIDNIEFFKFYEYYGKALKFAKTSKEKDQRPLSYILEELKTVIISALKEIDKDGEVAAMSGVSSEKMKSDANASPQTIDEKKEVVGAADIQVPSPSDPATSKRSSWHTTDQFHNAIFTLLTKSEAAKNSRILQSLGMDITEKEMARVSRVFEYDVTKLMRFVNDEFDMDKKLQNTRYALFEGFRLCGCNGSAVRKVLGDFSQDTKVSDEDSMLADVKKIWGMLCHDMTSTTHFEDVVKFFQRLLVDVSSEKIRGRLKATEQATKESVAKTDETLASGSNIDEDKEKQLQADLAGENRNEVEKLEDTTKMIYDEEITGNSLFEMDILCRLIVDDILNSPWNKESAQKLDSISLSGMESFVSKDLIYLVENRLRYLIMLEQEMKANSKSFLVHLYRSNVDNTFIVFAQEPISGAVYRCDGNDPGFSSLPRLKDMKFTEKDFKKVYGQHVDEVTNIVTYSCDNEIKAQRENTKPLLGDLFTHYETPQEEAAINGMLNRLKFVKRPESMDESSLMFAEDPKLVTTLKDMLDAANLPFFFTINDLCLCFEVDAAASKARGCIKKLVFGIIRNKKELSQYICQVTCNLKIVLHTYNGTEKEILEWSDMVAHLTDYRNPFVSVQLMPTKLEEEDYVYLPHGEFNEEKGDYEPIPIDPTEEEPEGAITIQRGPADYDGGSFPTWETSFSFKYEPPKLSISKIVGTQVAKVNIHNQTTYAVIFIREDHRPTQVTDASSDERSKKVTKLKKFQFMTVYDPRTATEYQCGIDDKRMWEIQKQMYPEDIVENDYVFSAPELTPECNNDELKKFQERYECWLRTAIEKDCILIGPIITPHVLITTYNQKSKNEEALGTCQISISSVLSGHGNTSPQWVTLVHKMNDQENCAGQLQVELSFKLDKDIENEKNAALKVKERSKKRAEMRKIAASTSNDESVRLSDKPTPEEVERFTNKYNEAIREVNKLKDEMNTKLDAAKKEAEALADEKKRAEKRANDAVEAVASSGGVSGRSAIASDEALVKTAELQKLRQHAQEREKLIQEKVDLEKQKQELQSKLNSARDSKDSSGYIAKMQKETDELKQENDRFKASEAKALAEAEFAKAELERLKKKMEEELSSAKEAAIKEASSSAKATENVPSLNLSGSEKVVEATPHSARRRTRRDMERHSKAHTKKGGNKGEDKASSPAPVNVPTPQPLDHSNETSTTLPVIRPKEERPSQSASSARAAGPKSTATNSPHKKDYSQEPLPEGWERRKDPNNNNRVYYVDHTTKKTSWDHPSSSRYRKAQKMARNNTSASNDDVSMSKTLQSSASSAGLNGSYDVDSKSHGGGSRPKTAGD